MTTKSRIRTGLAGLSAATMASSLVILGSSAAMADEIALGPDDIAGYENGDEDDDGYNYDSWHIGSNEEDTDLKSTDFLDFGQCNVTVKPSPVDNTTQVLKGYAIDERPDTLDAIESAMRSVEINATGTTTLQFPFFGYEVDEPDKAIWLGTWRTLDARLTDDSEMTSSLADEPDRTFREVIESLEATLENDDFLKAELLGVGFTGGEGAEISRFGFGGDDFYFGAEDSFCGFVDVKPGYLFYDEIYWMGEQGLSEGWAEEDTFRSSFRPLNRISREAMAAFLYRWAGEPEFDAPEESPFVDVKTDYTFYKEIAWLSEQEIADGWDDGTFRPLDRISREAMAAFLYRYMDADYDGPSVSPFKDVSTDYTFYDEIAWMHNQQIAEGWDNGTYRPLNRISREATAAFIFRLDPKVESESGDAQ